MTPYRAKKRLGQNFLKSPEITQRIIELVNPEPNDLIIEIGPGRGALTRKLAESKARVVAVEFDRDLIGYLRKLAKRFGNVEVVPQDFLTFEPPPEKFKLVGNLPFNITSPVIEWAQQYRESIAQACLMVQKEMARRLGSSPGSRDWSPLAIFTRLSFAVEVCFDVSPRHFTPPPKVTSTVVRLWPRQKVEVSHPDRFEKLVRLSFKQRRKTLLNNLLGELPVKREVMTEILGEAGLDQRSRAEHVTIEQFLQLTNVLVGRNIL
ncbi:MAG: ribosomal RNA small subunit methyltransferase A [Candidatus Zixiibacteriota bacterium]|nr:MAG: ribosomal RNA small subunit methyltransferase A [candidate division Zixibacteria bacterium]